MCERRRVAQTNVVRHGREQALRRCLRDRLASSSTRADRAVGVAEQASQRLGALCERSSATAAFGRRGSRNHLVDAGALPLHPGFGECACVQTRVLEISVGAGAKPRGGEVFARTSASDRCSPPSAGAAAAIRNAKPGLEPGAAVTRGHAKQTKSACEIPPIDGVGNWQSQFGRSGFGRSIVSSDRSRARVATPAHVQLKLMY